MAPVIVRKHIATTHMLFVLESATSDNNSIELYLRNFFKKSLLFVPAEWGQIINCRAVQLHVVNHDLKIDEYLS